MAVNDIYQNTLVAAQGTVALANVFYTKLTVDAGPPDDQDALVEAFIDQVVPAIKKTQSVSIIYECVLSRKVDPVTGPAKVYPITAGGDILSDTTPANLAITVTTRSLPWDPSAGGRYFLAGVPEIWITDGRLQQAFIEQYEDFTDLLTDGWSATGSSYEMWHFRKKFKSFAKIVTAQVQPIPSRQRNRTQRLCSIS